MREQERRRRERGSERQSEERRVREKEMVGERENERQRETERDIGIGCSTDSRSMWTSIQDIAENVGQLIWMLSRMNG